MVHITGSGPAGYTNRAIVTDAGELLTTAAVTVTLEEGAAYLPSGLITDLGSVYLMGGERVGSVWPFQIEGGSYLLIAGSISSIPSITTTAEVSLFDTGSIGAILSGTDTLLIEHTITAGSNFNLTGFDVTGIADGKFSLRENNTLLTQYRTNAAEQNIKKNFNSPISFTNGGSIMIFVEHGEELSQGFQGIVYGFESS